MNRITKMIQKLLFTARQRRTVPYSRKYTLNDLDIAPTSATAISPDEKTTATSDEKYELKQLWENLDPESDAWDRRLLYEVTGIADFGFNDKYEDTSDEERILDQRASVTQLDMGRKSGSEVRELKELLIKKMDHQDDDDPDGKEQEQSLISRIN